MGHQKVFWNQIEALLEGDDLKYSYWYVVDVSFREENPIHRAICQNKGDVVVLWGDYENPIEIQREKLYHFEVVATIPKMNR